LVSLSLHPLGRLEAIYLPPAIYTLFRLRFAAVQPLRSLRDHAGDGGGSAFAAENVEAIGSKVDRFRNLRREGSRFIPGPKHWEKD